MIIDYIVVLQKEDNSGNRGFAGEVPPICFICFMIEDVCDVGCWDIVGTETFVTLPKSIQGFARD